MNRHSNEANDRGTVATLRALRRAARRARELGARTGTPVYVIQDNRIVDLTKQDRANHHLPRSGNMNLARPFKAGCGNVRHSRRVSDG
jgi:hypothetical protein